MRALTLDSTAALSTSQDSAPIPAAARRWTGRLLSGLSMLFLTWDGLMKLVQPPVVVKASAQLGYTSHAVFVLGLLLLAFVALYLIPRTAVLGAVLLTGFLGGAVAINVRLGNPLFSHVLFPVYVAALFWGGLYLWDGRLSRLLRAGGR